MSFWTLYRKDLRQLLMPMLFLLFAGLVWHGFWFYRFSAVPNPETRLGISLIFPLAIMTITLIWFGIRSLRKEWQANTIYTLLSVPRSGREIIGSKLLAVLTYYLSIVLVQVVVIFFTYQVAILSGVSILENELNTTPQVMTMWVSFFILLWGSYLYLVAQFSYLVSKLWDKFNLAVSVVTFIVTNYLFVNLIDLLAPLFNWLPEWSQLDSQSAEDAMIHFSLDINSSGEIVACVLLLVGIYYLNSWLLEKKLDV